MSNNLGPDQDSKSEKKRSTFGETVSGSLASIDLYGQKVMLKY